MKEKCVEESSEGGRGHTRILYKLKVKSNVICT